MSDEPDSGNVTSSCHFVVYTKHSTVMSSSMVSQLLGILFLLIFPGRLLALNIVKAGPSLVPRSQILPFPPLLDSDLIFHRGHTMVQLQEEVRDRRGL